MGLPAPAWLHMTNGVVVVVDEPCVVMIRGVGEGVEVVSVGKAIGEGVSI